MCIEFYENMKVDVFDTTKSQGRGKMIMVTADTIASYMYYV